MAVATTTRPIPRSRVSRSDADTKIRRLSTLSVGRGSDAYADIPWDDPDMAISATDARMTLPRFDPVAQSAWFMGLSPAEQTRVASWRMSTMLRVGADFENLLQQGLLHRALHTPAGATEFRYLHHEVIEESQHTLMFHEVVNRLGLPTRGMQRFLRGAVELIVPFLARHRPHIFFLLVLAGEDPIDRVQRRSIAEGIGHPLVDKVMRTHVAEEARHVSFARLSLERDVAALSTVERRAFAHIAPIALSIGARIMLVPPRQMSEGLGIPHRTLTDPFRTPEGKAFLADSVSKPRAFLTDLGLMTRPARLTWRAMGVAG